MLHEVLSVMSWAEFLSFFQYPFVWRAIIVGTLIALVAALLGVTLVLKRFSFIGDGLSHVAFGAMAVAAVSGITDQMLIILPVTILAAVLLLRSGRRAKVNGDAQLALISVSALAIGYLIYNLSGSSNVSGDVCTTLFGSTSILELTPFDLWMSVGLSAAVVIVFVLLYHKIFAVTFDETFYKATGVKTELYNLMIAVVIAVIIVLAMDLVGSLLISALVIFPALSGMRLFQSFKKVTIFSAVLSVVCALLGLLLSIWLSTPVGSTIVAVDLVAFLACSTVGMAAKRA
mgnify:FL=1